MVLISNEYDKHSQTCRTRRCATTSATSTTYTARGCTTTFTIIEHHVLLALPPRLILVRILGY